MSLRQPGAEPIYQAPEVTRTRIYLETLGDVLPQQGSRLSLMTHSADIADAAFPPKRWRNKNETIGKSRLLIATWRLCCYCQHTRLIRPSRSLYSIRQAIVTHHQPRLAFPKMPLSAR